MLVIPDILLSDTLNALAVAISPVPGGSVIRLYTNNVSPTKFSVVSDFNELTNVQVPGYAAAPLYTQNASSYRGQTGEWIFPEFIDPAFYASGPPPAPIVVYGYFVTDVAGTTLYASGIFDSAYTFSQTRDGFLLSQVYLASQDGASLTVTLPNPQPA